MTEHSAAIFVFFFLAEYANIVLFSMLIAIFFFGGYNSSISSYFNDSLFIYDGLFFGFKVAIFIFIFIWIRASFPRVRYDQLMSFC
jgi:NADH-ubiquinone oxidoreductase chain 1